MSNRYHAATMPRQNGPKLALTEQSVVSAETSSYSRKSAGFYAALLMTVAGFRKIVA